jgi:hypothetical protein
VREQGFQYLKGLQFHHPDMDTGLETIFFKRFKMSPHRMEQYRALLHQLCHYEPDVELNLNRATRIESILFLKGKEARLFKQIDKQIAEGAAKPDVKADKSKAGVTTTHVIDDDDSIVSTSDLTDCELKLKIVEKKRRHQKWLQKLQSPLPKDQSRIIPNLPYFEEHSKKKEF